ncbi:hypothetical protein MRX96_053738 [Rhipicephalus microplus]
MEPCRWWPGRGQKRKATCQQKTQGRVVADRAQERNIGLSLGAPLAVPADASESVPGGGKLRKKWDLVDARVLQTCSNSAQKRDSWAPRQRATKKPRGDVVSFPPYRPLTARGRAPMRSYSGKKVRPSGPLQGNCNSRLVAHVRTCVPLWWRRHVTAKAYVTRGDASVKPRRCSWGRGSYAVSLKSVAAITHNRIDV